MYNHNLKNSRYFLPMQSLFYYLDQIINNIVAVFDRTKET